MKDWVDFGICYIPRWFTCPQTVIHPRSNHLVATRPGVEPTTSWSQVRHLTAVNVKTKQKTPAPLTNERGGLADRLNDRSDGTGTSTTWLCSKSVTWPGTCWFAWSRSSFCHCRHRPALLLPPLWRRWRWSSRPPANDSLSSAYSENTLSVGVNLKLRRRQNHPPTLAFPLFSYGGRAFGHANPSFVTLFWLAHYLLTYLLACLAYFLDI